MIQTGKRTLEASTVLIFFFLNANLTMSAFNDIGKISLLLENSHPGSFVNGN